MLNAVAAENNVSPSRAARLSESRAVDVGTRRRLQGNAWHGYWTDTERHWPERLG